MYKPGTLLKSINLGIESALGNKTAQTYCSNSKRIKFEKALIVSKLSRYEFEKRKHANLTDKALEKLLRCRGTNFERLVHFHDLHKRFEEKVSQTLNAMGIGTEIVNRFTCHEEKFKEVDVVIPTGGDGTFLLAASRILDNVKPVVGFNSDPNRSEGHLCLPKKYSKDIRGAIEKLQAGDFEWLMRSRIRTTFVNFDEKDLVPSYLHHVDGDCSTLHWGPVIKSGVAVLPCLALNEVFIGETLSARVSHLQMKFNGSDDKTNLKCSGICVSTGTGSTSWHLSINRLPVQTVVDLLKLIIGNGNKNMAKQYSDLYNKSLIFAADDKRMGYTLRDIISGGVWPQPKGIESRGFAFKMEVKSNCYDAALVVDGGVSFPFNDGTIAELEILPEDALRTVILT